jgi:glyoxylase-like metal-dependent hydrolase (beta-lactamase superfamily II)
VAFLHPSAAHGVLVEFVEAPSRGADLSVVSLPLGEMRVSVLHDGLFRLDGGAMFGVVPRTLWEKRASADDRNRIQLSMRPLLIEAEWGRLLVDCGAGDKWSERERDIYAFDRASHLDHALERVGLTAADIPLVVPTHLHFDHAGGGTTREGDRLVPRFPNARYLVRRAEWEDATHPHARNRASYLPQDFVPLDEAGVIDFFEGDIEVCPGVRVERTGGHTGQHQIVRVEAGSRMLLFPADLIPTTAHVDDPWIMGYDLFPVETLAVKQRLVREAIADEHLVVFEHDPVVPVGIIREREGRRFVEPVRYTS